MMSFHDMFSSTSTARRPTVVTVIPGTAIIASITDVVISRLAGNVSEQALFGAAKAWLLCERYAKEEKISREWRRIVR